MFRNLPKQLGAIRNFHEIQMIWRWTATIAIVTPLTFGGSGRRGLVSLKAGDITIDWDRGLISDSTGNQTALRAQSLAVLRELHDCAGRLVSKDDLLGKVWPDVAVTDDSLVQCITELRRAFKDEDHTVIKTLPKRGYIFEATSILSVGGKRVAPTYITALENVGRGNRAFETENREHSIAVLPFVNMSDDTGQEYFTDGLTEDVITDLSNIPGFFVIARNSCFAYKGKAQDIRQIAYDLGVRYIVEGSVRKSADRLRITVQLNDVEAGKQVWAERFDREMADIFTLQDEVTAKIVTSISGRLAGNPRSERHRPANMLAYDLCVRARNLWTQSREANQEAVSLLQQALLLEPSYVEALWRLGLSQLFCWLQYGQDEDYIRAEAVKSGELAVRLDPHDAGAKWALAFILAYEQRWEEARKLFQVSIDINPNDADAHAIYSDFLFLDGKHDASLAEALTALRLDPHPPGWHFWLLGQAQIACGLHKEAVATLTLEGTYRTASRRILAVALALLGRHQEANHEAQSYLANDPAWRFKRWIATRPFQKQADVAFWENAYRVAGFPE